MSRSMTAALLSGLLFPGVGHAYLKKYGRAAGLALVSIVAMSMIAGEVFTQASMIVERLNAGEGSIDVAEMAAQVSVVAQGSQIHFALLVLGACWIVGIVDSYRLGRSSPT
ncbi:MAG: hypothetical protein K0U93_02670 [Gammaproteobacteria bacterium]|nr:hypothetical protein [Gammaproteobacteria bacterium]